MIRPVSQLKRLLPHKNIKLLYYINCLSRELVPKSFCRSLLKYKLLKISDVNRDYLEMRLNYYNKLTQGTDLSEDAPELSTYKMPDRHKVYYFDFMEYARFFALHLKCFLLGGDVTEVPDHPTLTKSRPIAGDNRNSVLLKLNKVRHFTYIKYDKPYLAKKDLLIWRGSTGIAGLEHRKKFLKLYFNHPMCDIGNVNPPGYDDEYTKDRISFNTQLEYKFILCIEGVDVATNLKWVMSSNSVAVMPAPKYETWFMEGTLIPDYHYIKIKDDFSDLEERLNYFLDHPDKAQKIIKNAHEYVSQFKKSKREDLISLLVIEKYFVQTRQLKQISHLKYPSL